MPEGPPELRIGKLVETSQRVVAENEEGNGEAEDDRQGAGRNGEEAPAAAEPLDEVPGVFVGS